MDYSELDIYNLQGGESFMKKNIDCKNTDIIDENDKGTLRVYKKRIIEQRNEIDELKQKIRELEDKMRR